MEMREQKQFNYFVLKVKPAPWRAYIPPEELLSKEENTKQALASSFALTQLSLITMFWMGTALRKSLQFGRLFVEVQVYTQRKSCSKKLV